MQYGSVPESVGVEAPSEGPRIPTRGPLRVLTLDFPFRGK